MKLDRKVKTALNETRLLILGAQVLLGFQFEAFFQDGFSELSAASQQLCLVGLALVLLSVTVLVMPSMQHRLVERGQSSERLVSATSSLTGLGLVPLALSLAVGIHLVVNHHFVTSAGVLRNDSYSAIGAVATFLIIMTCWYVVPLLMRVRRSAKRSPRQAATPEMRSA